MAAAGGLAVVGLTTEETRAHAESIIANTQRLLSDLGVEMQAHICSGDPAQALITIAEAERAQIIVVGNRGMTGARRLLGSVPNRLSHHATCSVLIVPTTSTELA
jgi:nucleotide-binding universal stress UspA family protein